jgi:TetR/AcrR family transcriptional regulator, transcriptional repressor for nem operon
MAGRPRIFDEEEILNNAINLFWAKGFEATSTENLLESMGINKGSLYHTFGSKKELFSKALDFFARRSLKTIESKLKEAKTPIAGIRAFFMELATADSQTHQKGCFMGNTLAELSNIDKELKEKAAENLKDLENLFYKYVDAAKKSKELRTKEDSRVIARYLITVWNGINITRRMYPQKNVLESVLKMQLNVLN